MLDLSIVISVVLSMLMEETTGYLTGGLVSAGYFSMHMLQPGRIFATFATAVAVFVVSKAVGSVCFLYGRRRFLLMVSISVLLGLILERYLPYSIRMSRDFRVIGKIIPGLIANDMYRQGVVKTVVSLSLASMIVFLIVTVLGA